MSNLSGFLKGLESPTNTTESGFLKGLESESSNISGFLKGLGVQGDSMPTEDIKYTRVGFDPDSFGSILSRTLNESYVGGLDFLGVIGRQIGS